MKTTNNFNYLVDELISAAFTCRTKEFSGFTYISGFSCEKITTISFFLHLENGNYGPFRIPGLGLGSGLNLSPPV